MVHRYRAIGAISSIIVWGARQNIDIGRTKHFYITEYYAIAHIIGVGQPQAFETASVFSSATHE